LLQALPRQVERRGLSEERLAAPRCPFQHGARQVSALARPGHFLAIAGPARLFVERSDLRVHVPETFVVFALLTFSALTLDLADDLRRHGNLRGADLLFGAMVRPRCTVQIGDHCLVVLGDRLGERGSLIDQLSDGCRHQFSSVQPGRGESSPPDDTVRSRDCRTLPAWGCFN
jgi:hypothetical protein